MLLLVFDLAWELIYYKSFEAIYKDFITYSMDIRWEKNLDYPPMMAHIAVLSYKI